MVSDKIVGDITNFNSPHLVMYVKHEWSVYTIILYLCRFKSILWLSYFHYMKYVDRSNNVDWLRNLQVRFVSKKNSDVLHFSDLEIVSNNEKAIDIHKNIIYSFCGKFGHW